MKRAIERISFEKSDIRRALIFSIILQNIQLLQVSLISHLADYLTSASNLRRLPSLDIKATVFPPTHDDHYFSPHLAMNDLGFAFRTFFPERRTLFLPAFLAYLSTSIPTK